LQKNSKTKANVRSEQGAWYLRQKKLWVGGIPVPRWVIGARQKSIRLTPDIKQKNRETYSVGNQALVTKTGLNLDHHGYIRFG
jgi:hypothetical protein